MAVLIAREAQRCEPEPSADGGVGRRGRTGPGRPPLDATVAETLIPLLGGAMTDIDNRNQKTIEADAGLPSRESSEPARVLVVTAHPDDVDFGVAGSVAVWTDQKIAVSYCIVTDGSAGSSDPSIDPDLLIKMRQDEQREAAAQVGVSDVHFLGYPDGSLEVSAELRRDIARMIRIIRPDRVVCQSPERNWDRIRASHPDHLAAGEATLQAVYPDARNPYSYPELLAAGFEPHVVDEVWLMASPRTTHGVDITATIERKLAALRCHRSQMGGVEDLDGMIRSWTLATAANLGLPEGRLAEGFQVVDTR